MFPERLSAGYVDPAYQGLGIQPFEIRDGNLIIKARRTTPEQKAKLWGYNFASGAIFSWDSFTQTYGWFEARMKMPPPLAGLWPAFWLLPVNKTWPPEIDIVEQVAKEPNKVNVNMHVAASETGSKTGGGSFVHSAPLSADFHTYGVDWRKDRTAFYFDGKKIFERATPASHNVPMYVIVDLAVGGTWPGEPDVTGAVDYSKADLEIQYVRVWQ